VGRTLAEPLAETGEVRVVRPLRRGCATCSRDLRLMALELFEVSPRGEDEHAAVPEILTALDVLPGRLRIRLLHESLQQEPVFGGVSRRTSADVSVPRLGPGRDDAERNEIPVGS